MIEWLDDFYGDPDMRSTMLRNFLPVFEGYLAEAFGGAVPSAYIQSLAESYIDRHLGSSRAQLQEIVTKTPSERAVELMGARFDEWEEKRPTKAARNELVRSANAAAVQEMRARGVTKKVWRSSGGSCPFCSSLDGVIIELDSAFLEKGDILKPEGADEPMHFESSIGHPPVHQGCNCSIEASFQVEAAEDHAAEDDAAIDRALEFFDPDSGEDEALAVWYGEGYGPIRRAAAGDPGSSVRAREYAEQIAGYISNGRPSPSVVRGINVDELVDFKVGQTHDMNISSWSENVDTARRFASMPEMKGHPVVFRVDSVQGIGIGGDHGEQEWLTDGRFRITSVEPLTIEGLPQGWEVRLTQEAVFDPPELVGTR